MLWFSLCTLQRQLTWGDASHNSLLNRVPANIIKLRPIDLSLYVSLLLFKFKWTHYYKITAISISQKSSLLNDGDYACWRSKTRLYIISVLLKIMWFFFVFLVGTFHWLFLSIRFHTQLIIFSTPSKKWVCAFIEQFSSWNTMQQISGLAVTV